MVVVKIKRFRTKTRTDIVSGPVQYIPEVNNLALRRVFTDKRDKKFIKRIQYCREVWYN